MIAKTREEMISLAYANVFAMQQEFINLGELLSTNPEHIPLCQSMQRSLNNALVEFLDAPTAENLRGVTAVWEHHKPAVMHLISQL